MRHYIRIYDVPTGVLVASLLLPVWISADDHFAVRSFVSGLYGDCDVTWELVGE